MDWLSLPLTHTFHCLTFTNCGKVIISHTIQCLHMREVSAVDPCSLGKKSWALEVVPKSHYLPMMVGMCVCARARACWGISPTEEVWGMVGEGVHVKALWMQQYKHSSRHIWSSDWKGFFRSSPNVDPSPTHFLYCRRAWGKLPQLGWDKGRLYI